MSTRIAGILPVVHTPFLDDDKIDNASLRRQIDWAFQQGANGYCTGMVSELLRLTARERIDLTQELAKLKQDRGVFVASIGAESTRQAVQFAHEAEQAAADAVMAIPPISTRLPDDQLLEYFSTLAEKVDLPMIVQDASSYVGQQIPLSVCVQLVERFGPDKVMFKPEAAPVGSYITSLHAATDGQARIFDGSGGIFLVDNYRRGIVGTIPGMEFLAGIVALWKALERGDEQATYRVYFPICALVALQMQAGLDGFLAIEKYLLEKCRLFATDRRRKPYSWELDEATRLELERLLARLDEALSSCRGPAAAANDETETDD